MYSDTGKENAPKKFQVEIGGKIAYVEVISLKEQICCVEFHGDEPIFITRVRGRNNEPCWISIPQGNDELAVLIGSFIEKRLHDVKK